MAVFYKKMMISTIEDSISELCVPYCEPEKNQLGFCPTSCIPFCYPICHRPFLHSIPQIPPYANTIPHVHQRPEYQDSDESHNVFLLFFLSLLIVALLIFICYASGKFCKSWVESRREEEENQNDHPVVFLDQEEDESEVDHPIWHVRTDGLQSSVINSITVFKFRKNDGFVEGPKCSVCSVCLNNFQEDESLRLLPKCDHAFHVLCIDTWLKSHKNCPVCRSDIVLPHAALPSSSPEQWNSGGDSEEFRNQEGAETEIGEVGFQRGRENESVESSRKQ